MFELLDEEESLPREEQPVEAFYLWDTKKDVFELFTILSMYLIDGYRFEPTLLTKLVEKRNLDLEEILLDLPFILDGYLEVFYPVSKSSKSRRDVDGGKI